jgi:hypothetical protein
MVREVVCQMQLMEDSLTGEKPRSNDACSRIIENANRMFDDFQRKSFSFRHALAAHPLFELRTLLQLAHRIPKHPGFVYWQNGTVEVSGNWSDRPAKRLTLEETLEGIQENDSLIVLKHAEQDSVFGPLLREILMAAYEYAPFAVRKDIVLGESLIFINSPKRKTVYHFDLEPSLLLQIRGEKFVSVFDQNDASLVSHEMLEAYCNGNQDAAVYRPEKQAEAAHYHLTPGLGVHFPSTAPHWVQNGPQVAVSININFDLRSTHHRLRPIYKMNRYLRRLGLRPKPPGRSVVVDGVKAAVVNTMRHAAAPFHPNRVARRYPNWRPPRGASN